jgi:hypothetical protein
MVRYTFFGSYYIIILQFEMHGPKKEHKIYMCVYKSIKIDLQNFKEKICFSLCITMHRVLDISVWLSWWQANIILTLYAPYIILQYVYAPCIILQYVYKTNKLYKILVIRLYFILDALHVSDYISPSSRTTL